MKNFFAAIFCLVLLMTNCARAANAPQVLADEAILVEASTGRIIWEKNADDRRPPASMTKMLTCILSLENLKPNDEVKLTPEVLATEDVYFDWTVQDKITAWDMMNALMLVSENGGAVALAQAVGGDVPHFAQMMNDKARQLGCKGSHFVNPNGLPDDNHYSTAADMARIAVYCMKNPDFRKLVATQKNSIHWINPRDKIAQLDNTNRLLGNFNGANGIKTGWTVAAGGCLAASAVRNGVELIAIVMHSPDPNTRFTDAASMLDFGFGRVKMVEGLRKKDVSKNLLVRGGKKYTVRVGIDEDLNFPLLPGEDPKLFRVTLDMPRIVDADIDAGKILGTAILHYDGKPVARVPIVAKEDVPAGFSFASIFVSIIEPFLSV